MEFDSTDSVRNSNPLKYLQTVTFHEPLPLEHGGFLPEVTVAYETYGTLNERKDNAVLLCHALSGDSHVAAHNETDDSGWWEIMVGPGKPIDTDRYFVICPNVLGGCRGTTGPDAIHPQTGKRYGVGFPEITIGDIVETESLLIDYFGINRLLAVIGGSLGGICTLEWSLRFPDRLMSAVCLAAGPHLTSQSLAFDIVARNAIQSDPNFHNGNYYEHGVVPADGLAIARMLGHITYLSRESMMQKFDADRNQGRKIDTKFETKFSVGSYLAYQGEKFVDRFDANSYIAISTAIDTYELGSSPDELRRKLRKTMCRFLILSFSSDWLFPPFLSQEITQALLVQNKPVNYCNIPSDCGHDAFLLPNNFDLYGNMIGAFLRCGEAEVRNQASGVRNRIPETEAPPPDSHILADDARFDVTQIIDLIPDNTSVLDLGCGSGGLLSRLKQRGNTQLVGLEINEVKIRKCLEKGINAVQADINAGLKEFEDDQFDFVVLSKTLQTIRDVEFVLSEMVRVGTRCIVSFPNLGYNKYRQQLSEQGRAPRIEHGKTAAEWYNTDDVRFLTLADFEYFCAEKGIRIHYALPLDTKQRKHISDNPNYNADTVIMVVSGEVMD
ncbi:MAG: homoserine O-acetyltransferase [Planctomycetaceae bacterium]|jgi:homoserine O-acetyltransferase|nr:homoserine O-acetyltransferase [Planctomycetaceae bacterium]